MMPAEDVLAVLFKRVPLLEFIWLKLLEARDHELASSAVSVKDKADKVTASAKCTEQTRPMC